MVLICFAIPLSLAARDPDSLILQANLHYNSERYERAIEDYTTVLGMGYVSWELYYNTGNANFKLGQIPEAILYYEKARKLAPGNEDITYNLHLARSRITDKIDPVPELFLKTWWKDLRKQLSLDQWAWISVGSFICLLILAAIVLLSRSSTWKRISFWVSIAFLSMTILTVILAVQSYHDIHSEEEAIIFTPTVTVKSSPNQGSVDLFVIHEGTKVSITDEIDGWSEIRIADGNKGWVRKDTYRTI